jgi:hypothetical protein
LKNDRSAFEIEKREHRDVRKRKRWRGDFEGRGERKRERVRFSFVLFAPAPLSFFLSHAVTKRKK